MEALNLSTLCSMFATLGLEHLYAVVAHSDLDGCYYIALHNMASLFYFLEN